MIDKIYITQYIHKMYWVIFLNISSESIDIKNKIKNFAIAIILVIMTYLIIVFLTKNDNSFDTTLPVSNIQNTQYHSMKDILEDELYVIQNISEKNEGYEINIYYPYTRDENLNSYIKTKLDLYIKDIKFQASKYSEEVASGKYILNISFDVTKGSNDFLSFIFYVNQDIKYMHPNEYIFVINYDKINKKIIMQEDIENMYTNLYYNLSEYTYNELLKNEEIINMGALDMLKTGTHADKYNFMDLAFKEDNLLVLFEKYQVAPHVLGSFEVEVPLEYLKSN